MEKRNQGFGIASVPRRGLRIARISSSILTMSYASLQVLYEVPKDKEERDPLQGTVWERKAKKLASLRGSEHGGLPDFEVMKGTAATSGGSILDSRSAAQFTVSR